MQSQDTDGQVVIFDEQKECEYQAEVDYVTYVEDG